MTPVPANAGSAQSRSSTGTSPAVNDLHLYIIIQHIRDGNNLSSVATCARHPICGSTRLKPFTSQCAMTLLCVLSYSDQAHQHLNQLCYWLRMARGHRLKFTGNTHARKCPVPNVPLLLLICRRWHHHRLLTKHTCPLVFPTIIDPACKCQHPLVRRRRP